MQFYSNSSANSLGLPHTVLYYATTMYSSGFVWRLWRCFARCKTAVTAVLTQWIYCNLAPSHQYIHFQDHLDEVSFVVWYIELIIGEIIQIRCHLPPNEFQIIIRNITQNLFYFISLNVITQLNSFRNDLQCWTGNGEIPVLCIVTKYQCNLYQPNAKEKWSFREFNHNIFFFFCRPATNKKTGKVQQRIQFEAATINEFEYKLNL